MSLAEIDLNLRNSLISGEKCIGFVFHHRKSLWLIDWDDYFTLDQQKNIDAMCSEKRYQQFKPIGLTPDQ